MPPNPLRLLVAVVILGLAACGGNRVKDGPGSVQVPQPGDAIPKSEPRSKYGNGPVYEVFGKRYQVMHSSTGYKEQGVASWYGKKFHGRLTSNREVYDMYAMTAAHKTLPLPSYVRVRNLRNDRMIVVRVNDRGPFVDNRIIDLSYTAAQKLDMVRDGTALVEVTAIDVDAAGGDRPVSIRRPAAPTPAQQPAAIGHNIFVQVGAFGDRVNASRRLQLLGDAGIEQVFIHEDNGAADTLYKVRIGPVAGVTEYDTLVLRLKSIGIDDPYLISD